MMEGIAQQIHNSIRNLAGKPALEQEDCQAVMRGDRVQTLQKAVCSSKHAGNRNK